MRLPTWPSSMQWHSSSMCRHDCKELVCNTAHHCKAADGADMMQIAQAWAMVSACSLVSMPEEACATLRLQLLSALGTILDDTTYGCCMRPSYRLLGVLLPISSISCLHLVMSSHLACFTHALCCLPCNHPASCIRSMRSLYRLQLHYIL